MADTPLTNISFSKSVRNKLASLIKDDVSLINDVLSQYKTLYPGGTKLLPDNVFSGLRPDKRNIRHTPAITITTAGRDSDWDASRTTVDTVNLNITCCILMAQAPSISEDVIEDFTDATFSLLYKYTKFNWGVVEDFSNTEGPQVYYAVFDAKPTGIQHATVDAGALRVGNITWKGRIYVSQSQSY